MIFQQSEFELPEGVCCMDTLATLKRRARNYFKLPIVNNTNSNITLSNNTEIGRLEYTNSITSFEVHVKEQQQACVNTDTSSINRNTPTLRNIRSKTVPITPVQLIQKRSTEE